MNIGDHVAGYEVIDHLGSGAMGRVYKVRNLVSGRIEAMKVLLPSLGAQPELLDRFQREIRIQAGLSHPNIAHLQTAQQVDGELLMVLEYVEGETLEKILNRRKRLTPQEGIYFASQVLSALSYAHSQGAVHRDIKPANLMVTSGQTIKVMDFGVAYMRAERPLTRTGHTVGSLFYMSPEQIQGGQVDARSDIYSFGITLYEIVTGCRPFQGDSDYSIMMGHCRRAPKPPIEVLPEIEMDLNDAILKAIGKTPADRFQTADDFRHALESISQGSAAEPATRIMVEQPHAAEIHGDAGAGGRAPSNAFGSVFSAQALSHSQDFGASSVALGGSASSGLSDRKPGSHRTLYMVLGAALTLSVLVLVGFGGPRLFQSAHARNAFNPTTVRPSPVNPSSPSAGGSAASAASQTGIEPNVEAPLAATASISGIITSASGSSIPEARVRATEIGTGSRFEGSTDAQGHYEIAGLAPGTYKVEVGAQGFRESVRERVVVGSEGEVSLDSSLQAAPAPEVAKSTPKQSLPSSSASPREPARSSVPAQIPADVRERFASLRARFTAYDEELETISNQLKSEGATLRPALSVARNDAREKLSLAQSQMAEGKISEAQRSLGDVEASLTEIERIHPK